MTEQAQVVDMGEENAKLQERISQLETENSELKRNLANEQKSIEYISHLSKLAYNRLDEYHDDISHYRKQAEKSDELIQKLEKDVKERDLHIEQIEKNAYKRQIEDSKEINRLKEELRRLKV
jgi:chromosome segregation ATPase